MTWAKLDDHAHEHRKQLAAGGEACWLWACGLMYANRQRERDGFIPEGAIGMLFPLRNAKHLAAKLVEVGLWEKAPGGYQIHDFTEWNQTREQRDAELAAGRERAAKSYANRLGQARNSSPEETAKLRCVFPDSPGSTPTPTPTPDQIPPNPPSGGKPAAPAKRPRKSKVRAIELTGELEVFPDPFIPTAAHRALAAKHGLDVELEAIACRGHFDGQRVASPNGRFSTWLCNQAKWKKERQPPPGAVAHRQFRRDAPEAPKFNGFETAQRIGREMENERKEAAENERRRAAANALRLANDG